MKGNKRSESPSVPDLTYDIAREREFYRYAGYALSLSKH